MFGHRLTIILLGLGGLLTAQEDSLFIASVIDQVQIYLDDQKPDSADWAGEKIYQWQQTEKPNDGLLLARSWVALARLDKDKKNNQQAREMVRRAIAFFRAHPRDSIDLAKALETMALSWYAIQGDSMRKYLDDALAVTSPNNHEHIRQRGRVLYQLSRWYKERGHYDSLFITINQTIKLLGADPNIYPTMLAQANRLKGVWHEEQGDLQGAEKIYDLAEEIFAMKYPRDHLYFSFLAIDRANVLLYQDLTAEAEQYLNEALEIKLKAHGKFHNGTAYTYQMLGNLFNHVEDYARAINYNKTAIEINDSLYGKDNRWSANIYNNLGISLSIKGDRDEAVACFQKSIDDNTRVLGPDNYELPYPLFNLGDHHRDLERWDSAAYYYREGTRITEKIYGDSYRMSISGRFYLARVALAAGELDRAQQEGLTALRRTKYETDAEDPFKEVVYPSVLLEGFLVLSQIREQKWIERKDTMDLELAIQKISRGDELISYTRKKFSEDASKLDFGNVSLPLYEQGINIALQHWQETNDPASLEKAWYFCERSKSQSLLEALYASEALSFAGISDSLIDKAGQLQREILNLENSIEQLDTSDDQGLPVIELAAGLGRLKMSFSDLIKKFEIEHPEYYALKYQPAQIDLLQTRQLAEDLDGGMVSYFLGENSAFVFVVLPDTVLALPLDEASISKNLDRFLGSIHQKENMAGQSITSYFTSAYQLYQDLFGRIEVELPEQLVIIPDGGLGLVPFEALLYDTVPPNLLFTVPFLIKKYVFSYSYSSALLLEARKSDQSHQNQLVCFAPSFDNQSTPGSEPSRSNLSPLRFNQFEARQILKQISGQGFFGLKASRSAFNKYAGEAQILHLATHAVADNDRGENSFLAFSHDANSKDHLLFVRDLYAMTVPAELVVLSACQTAQGEWQKGEGIISLARAFIYAGANSIVSSLWNVNDEATSKLMSLFYGRLKQNDQKHVALQKAKINYLAEATEAIQLHPYYWASMICLGNTDPINPGASPGMSRPLVIVLGLLLFTIVLSLFLGRTS